MDANKFEGKVWAFPETTEAVALWYNKDLVKTPPKDTDELLKLAAEVGLAFNTGFYHTVGLLLRRRRQALRRQPASAFWTRATGIADVLDLYASRPRAPPT